MSDTPSEILPGRLWLSSMTAARDADVIVSDLGITHIVNCTNRCAGNKFEDQGVEYWNVDAEDGDDTQLSDHFEPVFDFVSRGLEGNGKVLIHCMAGASRSPTLTIYCVMRLEDQPLIEAYRLVKARRAQIRPSEAFARQLIDAEVRLRGPPASAALADMDLRPQIASGTRREVGGALDRLSASRSSNICNQCSLQ